MTSTGTTPVDFLARWKNRRAPSLSPPTRRVHVDDLPELVDRPIQVDPPPGDPDVGLVHVPPVADSVPAEPGRVGQQRREAAHPPVHGDVIHRNAALGGSSSTSR
jgi:hypothetical protein